jgi:phosphomannomutase/phosphoglucomutase
MNPLIFREYDIRGVAATELPDNEVYRLGQAFGTYAQKRGARLCTVGRDARLSGPRIQKAVTDGILSTGLNVIDLGLVPTPVFYFSFFHLGADSGIMVTASHNPPEFNGFKVGLRKTTIFGKEIQSLRRLMEAGRFRTGKGRLVWRDIVPAYVKMCQSKVRIKSPLKVVFDSGNGTTGVLLERLFRGTPVRARYIFLKPDGGFPYHMPDPTVPECTRELSKLVRQTRAGCGIGYDGDGDRIGAVDETGRMVYGDRLLGMCATEVIRRHPGARVVFDVKCSQGLVEHIRARGGTPLMWKTGHSLMKARMKQERALLAGEMSGHMFFADNYYGYDDAIFASLRVLSILSSSGRRFSEIAAEMPFYYSTPELRAECPDTLKFPVVKELQSWFKKKHKVITLDGARVVFKDGWGLVRASNTQPILVLRFEARTRERLAEIRELFYERLGKYPQVKLPGRAKDKGRSPKAKASRD